jgi:hypothetical protein
MSLGHAANLATVVLMVAMLAACLYCAHDLWVRGTLRGWALVASMNLAMIAVHMPASSAHHHGGAVAAAAPAHGSMVMTLATAFAALEAAAAAAVLYYRSRALRPDDSAPAVEIRRAKCGAEEPASAQGGTHRLTGWPGPTVPIDSPQTTRGSSAWNRRRSLAIR